MSVDGFQLSLVRLIGFSYSIMSEKRQELTPSVRLKELFVKRELTVNTISCKPLLFVCVFAFAHNFLFHVLCYLLFLDKNEF